MYLKRYHDVTISKFSTGGRDIVLDSSHRDLAGYDDPIRGLAHHHTHRRDGPSGNRLTGLTNRMALWSTRRLATGFKGR